MSAIPLAGAGGALAGNARRTVLVRRLLAAAVCILVVLAALAARHPATTRPTSLPVRSGDIVVLDLSASISSDTFSRIGETLRKLVATGGRYGLVVFSNVAYEALPPGTRASALRPLIRYFTVAPNATGALPTSPWTLSFSRGTRISAGLDLAHRIIVENHLDRARVVLISDLADDPADIQRLNEVATTEYGRGRTALRVVALNAAPADAAFFEHIAGAAIADAAPAPQHPAPPAAAPRTDLPLTLVLAIVAAVVALAIYALWAARLRWSPG
jgi:hypothetical protein